MRKQILVIVIMCGLLLSLRAQTQTAKAGQNPALSTQCATKNPFLAALKSQGVTIYESPQINNEKCGNEWKQFGSCCEQSTLVNYAQQDYTDLFNRFNNIHLEYMKFKGRMDKEILKQKDSVKKELENIQKEAKAIFTKVNEQGFFSCPDILAKVRSSSLCDTCSGRSERYFTTDKYAQLSLSDCKTVIDGCSLPWKIMAEMITMMSKLTVILKKHDITITGADIRDDNIQKTESWLKEIELEKLLKDCNCSANKCDCKPDNAKKLCDNLITLNKAPIVIDPISGSTASSQSSSSTDSSQSSSNLWKRRVLQLLSKGNNGIGKGSFKKAVAAAAVVATVADTVQKTSSTLNVQLAGDVRVVSANYTESGPNSSMDLSLNFP